jgi:transcriptional regulator with XRE-family HTH domain
VVEYSLQFMESIGQRFKTARERKRVSLSQAAAKTRIKIQVLEGMEQDDFSKIPAPAYARGFIRMYAEFLGLDAGPLLKEYAEVSQGRPPAQEPPRKAVPTQKSRQPAPAPARDEPDEPEPEPAEQEAVTGAGQGRMVSTAGWHKAAVLVGAIVVVVVIVGLVSRGGGGDEGADAEVVQKPPAPKRDLSAIVQEPADPYLERVATNSP